MTNKKVYESMSLQELLVEVDLLFKEDHEVAVSYNYSLNKFPAGWNFTVTNDWHQWMDKGYKHQFGIYTYPEGCVIAFLNYVRNKKINVYKLATHYTKKQIAEWRKREKET